METGEQYDNSVISPHDILEAEKQSDVKKKAEWLTPWQFKKGQSGNPSGRPPGKSLKEYAKEMLSSMTDEERQNYLHGLPKEIIWKMAESNPAQATDITSKGEAITFNLIKYGDPKPPLSTETVPNTTA